jgi:cytochrome c oxidase subunit 1
VHTGVAGAVAGYVLGHWLGNFLGSGYPQLPLSDSPDLPIVLGYLLAIAGWLAGLGVFNDPVRQILGRPVGHAETEATTGMARYFRYSLDHKVVGLQYLAAMLVYFCTAGLFAMAIRTELLSPVHHVFSSSTYVEIVSEHGTMMMMLMTSVVVGPFGNYLVPIMIGSKRVAFPRIEALSFWLTPAAFLILLSGILVGGFHFGWTNYAPGSVQDTPAATPSAVAFGLMACPSSWPGSTGRHRDLLPRAGMTWGLLPMFVWSMLATSFLMVLAAPVVGSMYMILTDDRADRVLRRPARRQQLPCTRTCSGSSAPEVYILPCPLRHRVRDHPGVLPQAAVRLQDRRGGMARGDRAQLLRLAAPPVRQRDQPACARCSCSPPS